MSGAIEFYNICYLCQILPFLKEETHHSVDVKKKKTETKNERGINGLAQLYTMTAEEPEPCMEGGKQ